MGDIVLELMDAIADVARLAVLLHFTHEKVRLPRNVHAHHDVYTRVASLRFHVDLPKFQHGNFTQQVFQ